MEAQGYSAIPLSSHSRQASPPALLVCALGLLHASPATLNSVLSAYSPFSIT